MPTKEEILEGHRKRIFEGEDRTTYLHLGYFMAWYSACEARISMLLALATGFKDLEAFDLLTRGMDAKVKIERFKTRCEPDGIGDNLASRLTYFYDHIIPLRNKIAHSYMTTDPSFSRVHFASLSRLPFEAFGLPKSGQAPQSEPFEAIFEKALWLNFFHDDLKQAWTEATRPKTFEIKAPSSPLLQAAHPQSHPKAAPSTPSRRERKRLRKGLQPRGSRTFA